MAATRKKQTVIEEVSVDPDVSQSVIAYRVGQLEKTQAQGFASLNSKLDEIAGSFITKAELATAQAAADKEHEIIYGRIADNEKDINELNRKRWVQNTLSVILGAVLSILIAYFIQNIGR